ncbi:hypothetical protein A6A20_02600 [Volucribacter amazonae]|uniref:Colicin transporter n=1 Tax=Volucribacter amazonae TaxID=256731 RepID=A0A9X4SKZ6_9PAST|nr:hypothetical protein [Volucribacter amazonae]
MNKKYYFKNIVFSLTVSSISVYKIIQDPLTGYKQYTFLIWLISNALLYPFAKYFLEKLLIYIVPTKLAKHRLIDNLYFSRVRHYFYSTVCFLFSIPILLCVISYKAYFKSHK